MNRIVTFVCLIALLLAVAVTISCGNGKQPLQSVTITPATADAQKYSGGMVQFSAVGFYAGGESRQMPSSALSWCASPGPGVCIGENVKPGVTIDQNGLAQCQPGSVGTWTINANSPPTSQAAQPGGEIGASIIFGSATLTCP